MSTRYVAVSSSNGLVISLNPFAVLFKLDGESAPDPGKGGRFRHELVAARDFTYPDLAGDMGHPGLGHRLLPGSIGGSGKKPHSNHVIKPGGKGRPEMIFLLVLPPYPDVVLPSRMEGRGRP